MDTARAVRALQRAETPYILYPDDIALVFRLGLDEAREAIQDGLLGPWFSVRGDPAVLRETLRQHLGILITQRGVADRELLRPTGRGLEEGGAGRD